MIRLAHVSDIHFGGENTAAVAAVAGEGPSRGTSRAAATPRTASRADVRPRRSGGWWDGAGIDDSSIGRAADEVPPPPSATAGPGAPGGCSSGSAPLSAAVHGEPRRLAR